MDHDVSPDSGHRELSTDSLATSVNTQSDMSSWHSALAANTSYYHDLAGRLHNPMLSSQTCPVIASHHAMGDGFIQSHHGMEDRFLQSHHATGDGFLQSQTCPLITPHHAADDDFLHSHHAMGDGLLQSQTCPIIASHHAVGDGLHQFHNAAVGTGVVPSSKTMKLDLASQNSLVSDTADIYGRVLKNVSLQSCRRTFSPDSKSSVSTIDKSLSAIDKSFSHNDGQLFANEDSTLSGEEGKSFLDDSDILSRSIAGIQQY